jgi:hypothetical protein
LSGKGQLQGYNESVDFRTAIKNQTHAAIAMLAECIEGCPPALWLSGDHPRPYWKTAYHVTAYSHLYLFPNLDSWEKWTHHRREATWTFSDDGAEIPEIEPYTPEQVMEYIHHIQGQIDERIDALDLDETDCGFTWYPGLPRAELLILNIRHISEHVGQLHELRIAAGLDVDWRSTRDY